MSDLMTARNNGKDLRWQLLVTVSSVALLGALSNMQDANAEVADRPTVWIELGGQLEQSNGGQEPFAPAFVDNLPNNFYSPLNTQKPALYSYGGEGKISFQPEGGDWIFSASVRYGRSNSDKNRHQQTANAKIPYNVSFFGHKYGSKYPDRHFKFEDVASKQYQSHAVLDFLAGKDVGLGMFSGHGSSVISAGVRIAQFSSRSNVGMHMRPDLHYPTVSKTITSLTALAAVNQAAIHFHNYSGFSDNKRSFRGIGPSLTWTASTPFLGHPETGEMTLDWGANAAILFGRQKASGQHQTTTHSYYLGGSSHNFQKTISGLAGFSTVSVAQHNNAPPRFSRSRSVIVPNIGGFAGISFEFPNAKLSLGYRGDFFFGAMDGGIDARKSETLGFYGPFASVSVGIGG
jgi:hypothetical protein